MRRCSAELWAKWRGLVSEQGASGQPVTAFCSDRGLRRSMFYKWKSRFAKKAESGFLEVKVVAGKRAECVKPAAGRAIEIRLKGSRSLLVEPGFDAHHLRALLSVLEAGA